MRTPRGPLIAALFSTLISLLTGCMGHPPRTASVQGLDIGAGEIHLDPGASPKLLVVQVLESRAARTDDTVQSAATMRIVPLAPDERDLLTARLGTPSGVAVEVAMPASFPGPDITGQSLAARARERGCRWLLISSVDTVPSAWSSMALVSMLTIGILPFNVGCTGIAQAALYDLQSGTRLDQWSFDDPGWQVANFYTYGPAQSQMADRANHRMMRRIGKGAAVTMAAIEPKFKASVAAAKVRIDGWGEE